MRYPILRLVVIANRRFGLNMVLVRFPDFMLHLPVAHCTKVRTRPDRSDQNGREVYLLDIILESLGKYLVAETNPFE